MTDLELLLTRQSVSPRLMEEPAPSEAELDTAFRAALCAPDHGGLQPWRFRVVRGEARKALGDLYAEALLRKTPDATEQQIEAARIKPLRAPMVIVVLAKITTGHPKVPPVEQVVSAGAAVQNMLNCFHGMGYGAMLVTGVPAYDPGVRAAFGLDEDDALIGFLNVGTVEDRPASRHRPEPADFVEEWSGHSV